MSKLQTTQGPYDGAMEMKSKLYLRIILLINYMMEENLFVYVECSTVKHAASRFSVKKRKKQEWKKKKKRKKVTPGWTDISDPGPVSFLARSSMYYIILTLHNSIKPRNIVSTNSFSQGPNFTSTTTWCANDLRRLQLARIKTNDLRRL